tara:strand:+ start:2371 stop:2889 length:519 start_codon:yes stop_codon:yes gene_type:complete
MTNNSAKVINLADRRAKKENDARNAPIHALITWLYCPKCKSLEYSEIEMPNGRIHKQCGNMVDEEEVEIEVRAEYTISLRNSRRLDELFEGTKIPGFLKPVAKKGIGMLERLQAAEKEYRRRLENIVDGPVIPYPDDWDEYSLEMNLKTLNPIGLILTEARQPNLHFPEAES